MASVLIGAIAALLVVVVNRLVDIVLATRADQRALKAAARLYGDELATIESAVDFVKEHRQWVGDEWPDQWAEHRLVFSSNLSGDEWRAVDGAHRATVQVRRARDYAVETVRAGEAYVLAGRDFFEMDGWIRELRAAQAVLARLAG